MIAPKPQPPVIPPQTLFEKEDDKKKKPPEGPPSFFGNYKFSLIISGLAAFFAIGTIVPLPFAANVLIAPLALGALAASIGYIGIDLSKRWKSEEITAILNKNPVDRTDAEKAKLDNLKNHNKWFIALSIIGSVVAIAAGIAAIATGISFLVSPPIAMAAFSGVAVAITLGTIGLGVLATAAVGIALAVVTIVGAINGIKNINNDPGLLVAPAAPKVDEKQLEVTEEQREQAERQIEYEKEKEETWKERPKQIRKEVPLEQGAVQKKILDFEQAETQDNIRKETKMEKGEVKKRIATFEKENEPLKDQIKETKTNIEAKKEEIKTTVETKPKEKEPKNVEGVIESKDGTKEIKEIVKI